MLAAKNSEVGELSDELCLIKKKFPLLFDLQYNDNTYERRDTMMFSGSENIIVFIL